MKYFHQTVVVDCPAIGEKIDMVRCRKCESFDAESFSSVACRFDENRTSGPASKEGDRRRFIQFADSQYKPPESNEGEGK